MTSREEYNKDIIPKLFEIDVKSMDIKGNWAWDCKNDICPICRNDIDDSCVNCSTNNCKSIIGECGHAFHYHCIQKWLKTNYYKQLCPLCKNNFVYKTIE